MSQALRQRRVRAARALVVHERRAQLGWDDLAAWPDWADAFVPAGTGDGAAPPPAVADLATHVGAVWHAAALRRCIHGPTLKRLQAVLGDSTFKALIEARGGDGLDGLNGADTPAADPAALPAADRLHTWLQAQGADVMLAAVPAPLLRLALRERWWPKSLQALPSPDTAGAARALARASALSGAKALNVSTTADRGDLPMSAP